MIGGTDLSARKALFANDWVKMDAFLTIYPDSLTAEEFVNKLFDSADLRPYAAERQKWIAAMRSGAARADILTGVIEDEAFISREYNPSFVLMQYFGYLRRDEDQKGYEFWLNVLNESGAGNYSGMVCSFITSAEYQQRFGRLVSRSNAECGQ